MNSEVLERETDSVSPIKETPDLRDYRGKPLLLAFFPTDWDPGREHQMELFSQALSIRPENLRMSRSSSDSGAIYATLEEIGDLDIPILDNLDSNGVLADSLGVRGNHALLLLDSEGVVIFRHETEHGSLPRADELVNAMAASPARNVSRRQFVLTAVAVLAAIMLVPRVSSAETTSGTDQSSQNGPTISLNINGHEHKIPADPRITVLNALRDYIGMTGTKKGCDHGQCGACTIHLNGRRVNSCLLLAAQAQGSRIETIEGLANGEELHPVQEAFIEHDGFQCGYCTPGQIMSAVACIREGHTGSPEEIREWMSGNICRCGAYQGILDSIQDAKQKMGAK